MSRSSGPARSNTDAANQAAAGFLRLRGFARQIRMAQLHRVAGNLHLALERELVRDEAQRGEDVRVEVLGLRVVGGGAEPLVVGRGVS
jgi:hypothetical protein